MADVSWASLLTDTEFEAYRSARKTLRTMASSGAAQRDALIQAVALHQPSDPPNEALDGDDDDKRIARYRAAFLEGRERAALEFITGSDDAPPWVPPLPGEHSTIDAIVRPVLFEYLGYHGVGVTFILNDGLKWTVNSDRGTLTYRLVRPPTGDAPIAYVINTSFILDTTQLELFLLYRLYAYR